MIFRCFSLHKKKKWDFRKHPTVATRVGARARSAHKVKGKGEEKCREGGGQGEERKPPRGSLPQKPDTKLIPRGPTKPLPRWPTKPDATLYTKVFVSKITLENFCVKFCVRFCVPSRKWFRWPSRNFCVNFCVNLCVNFCVHFCVNFCVRFCVCAEAS